MTASTQGETGTGNFIGDPAKIGAPVKIKPKKGVKNMAKGKHSAGYPSFYLKNVAKNTEKKFLKERGIEKPQPTAGRRQRGKKGV